MYLNEEVAADIAHAIN